MISPTKMMKAGYLTLFRIRGIPIRAHWTLPLGLLFFSGGRLAPGLWIGIVAIIVLHELGHAFVVNRVGLANLGIDLTGFGGQCRWAGSPSPTQRAWVAWGGVLAQLPLLLVSWLLITLLGVPESAFVADLAEAFVRVNGILIVINLIPFPPLDGAEAWPLLGHLRRDWQRKREWKKRLVKRPPEEREARGPDPEPNRRQTLREALDEAERRTKN
jgi:Zn-dependent protease